MNHVKPSSRFTVSKKLPILQNRRQKLFNRGTLSLCVGAWHSEIYQNSNNLQCFIFQFGGLEALFGGLSPPKSPVATGLDLWPTLFISFTLVFLTCAPQKDTLHICVAE